MPPPSLIKLTVPRLAYIPISGDVLFPPIIHNDYMDQMIQAIDYLAACIYTRLAYILSRMMNVCMSPLWSRAGLPCLSKSNYLMMNTSTCRTPSLKNPKLASLLLAQADYASYALPYRQNLSASVEDYASFITGIQANSGSTCWPSITKVKQPI